MHPSAIELLLDNAAASRVLFVPLDSVVLAPAAAVAGAIAVFVVVAASPTFASHGIVALRRTTAQFVDDPSRLTVVPNDSTAAFEPH